MAVPLGSGFFAAPSLALLRCCPLGPLPAILSSAVHPCRKTPIMQSWRRWRACQKPSMSVSAAAAYLDPYNATLAAAGLPSTATAALAEFATSYAFASDYPALAFGEGLNGSDK